MKECSEVATIRTFKPFDIVYCADSDQINNSVHIILSGHCSILQYLNMNVVGLRPPLKKESEIQQIFTCNVNQEKILKDSSDLNDCGNVCDTHLETKISRRHFVEIGEYSCGSMFGLGEHMEDRVIVAKHKEVQCLLIPHYFVFKKKQNAGNIWQRLFKLEHSHFQCGQTIHVI